LNVQVMEASQTALDPEHPETLASILESGAMGRGGEAEYASDGSKKDSTGPRAS
jgi:hypothetical protein